MAEILTQQYVNVLTIPFIKISRSTLVNELIYFKLANKEKALIVTANPEIVEYANSHMEYKTIVKSADFIVPDGIGIIMASKLLKEPLDERITGYDLLFDLLALADKHSYKVYLLGAEEEVIIKTANLLKRKFPSMILTGYHHGFIDINDTVFAQTVADCEPDIIITALGFPRQEEWIKNHYSLFNKGVFLGVGGSFDVIAGKVKRAPLMWQRMNLEWLYRLIKQPSRWKRMLVLPKFMLKVFFKKIMIYMK